MATGIGDLLSFDASGWQARPSQPDRLLWGLPGGGSIGVFVFGGPPEIPQAGRLAELRQMERQMANEQGHALVEYRVDMLPAGVQALRSITRMPTDPSIELTRSGLSYVGMLTVPFQRLAVVVKAQAREIGPSGVRESVTLQTAIAHGRVKVHGPGQIAGWIVDPGDNAGPLDCNLSDDPALDEKYPDHPLSKVRAALNRVEATFKLKDTLRQEPGFPLPAA